jgi:hypothetical protein
MALRSGEYRCVAIRQAQQQKSMACASSVSPCDLIIRD